MTKKKFFFNKAISERKEEIFHFKGREIREKVGEKSGNSRGKWKIKYCGHPADETASSTEPARCSALQAGRERKGMLNQPYSAMRLRPLPQT